MPKQKQNVPVTKAFCNCPLSPVTQGFTVPTFLARQYKAPTADMIRKAEIPAATKP
jgi:hypothetical protein